VAHIPHITIERHIQKAFKNNTQLRVGEILVKARVINETMVQKALKVQKLLRKRIGEMLLDRGLLSEEQLFQALAEKFSIPYVDLLQEKFARKALAAIPGNIAAGLDIIPINFDQTTLVVATIAPELAVIKTRVQQHTNQKHIQMVLARPSQLRAAIRKFYS
jgi:hypothetical protein